MVDESKIYLKCMLQVQVGLGQYYCFDDTIGLSVPDISVFQVHSKVLDPYFFQCRSESDPRRIYGFRSKFILLKITLALAKGRRKINPKYKMESEYDKTTNNTLKQYN